ncbi:hypothetical protein BDB01DRAFT_843200 [Pilobolus umbonatus]|nr:hypothetical protein BDB01DRAFT_843200 [Pilobolus umbonatus]
MSIFLQLPIEILEYIIDISSRIEKEDDTYFIGWLYPEHSYVHLKSIALTCRQLYTICAPYLWKDKEFILPRDDDQKGEIIGIHMATDILSNKGLFQQHRLGDYVRSLKRDLMNSPHYKLDDSILMAHLVSNLQALRIDFHPTPRLEGYGLKYFAQYCPHLSELYLSNCRDTYDDFLSLYDYQVHLQSLTLIQCSIKEHNLEKISLLKTLKTLLLQELTIEPLLVRNTNIHSMSMDIPVHPFHYHSWDHGITHSLYQGLIEYQHLTELALKDPMSCRIIYTITQYSPYLEKLSIVIHDEDPYDVTCAIIAISRLERLVILSIEFGMYGFTRENELLQCHASSGGWHLLATHLPLLNTLNILSNRVIVRDDFLSVLLHHHPHITNIMIHSITYTTYHKYRYNEEYSHIIRTHYEHECQQIESQWDLDRRLIRHECDLLHARCVRRGFHI